MCLPRIVNVTIVISEDSWEIINRSFDKQFQIEVPGDSSSPNSILFSIPIPRDPILFSGASIFSDSSWVSLGGNARKIVLSSRGFRSTTKVYYESHLPSDPLAAKRRTFSDRVTRAKERAFYYRRTILNRIVKRIPYGRINVSKFTRRNKSLRSEMKVFDNKSALVDFESTDVERTKICLAPQPKIPIFLSPTLKSLPGNPVSRRTNYFSAESAAFAILYTPPPPPLTYTPSPSSCFFFFFLDRSGPPINFFFTFVQPSRSNLTSPIRLVHAITKVLTRL